MAGNQAHVWYNQYALSIQHYDKSTHSNIDPTRHSIIDTLLVELSPVDSCERLHNK